MLWLHYILCCLESLYDNGRLPRVDEECIKQMVRYFFFDNARGTGAPFSGGSSYIKSLTKVVIKSLWLQVCN